MNLMFIDKNLKAFDESLDLEDDLFIGCLLGKYEGPEERARTYPVTSVDLQSFELEVVLSHQSFDMRLQPRDLLRLMSLFPYAGPLSYTSASSTSCTASPTP